MFLSPFSVSLLSPNVTCAIVLSNEEVDCIAKNTAAYMNSVIETLGTRQYVKLLSPAFNLTSPYLERLITQMTNAEDANWDGLYAISGNAYNVSGVTITTFANNAMALPGLGGRKLIITEMGIINGQPPTNPTDGELQALNNEVRIMRNNFNNPYIGGLLFNSMGTNPDPQWKPFVLDDRQRSIVCGSNPCYMLGENLASFWGQYDAQIQKAQSIGMDFMLVIVDDTAINNPAFLTMLNKMHAADITPIIRIGTATGGAGSFEQVENYVNFLDWVDENVNKVVLAIAGPNEPTDELWIGKDCTKSICISGEDPLAFDDDYHSLRPARYCPLTREDPKYLMCGHDLIASEKLKLSYSSTLSVPEEGIELIDCERNQPVDPTQVKCTYKVTNRKIPIKVDLNNAKFPIYGITEEKHVSNALVLKADPEFQQTLSQEQMVNNFLSWYLHGTVFRPEYDYPTQSDVVNFSGPVRKLLPWRVQAGQQQTFVNNVTTYKTQHNQIIGCFTDSGGVLPGLLTIPVPCYGLDLDLILDEYLERIFPKNKNGLLMLVDYIEENIDNGNIDYSEVQNFIKNDLASFLGDQCSGLAHMLATVPYIGDILDYEIIVRHEIGKVCAPFVGCHDFGDTLNSGSIITVVETICDIKTGTVINSITTFAAGYFPTETVPFFAQIPLPLAETLSRLIEEIGIRDVELPYAKDISLAILRALAGGLDDNIAELGFWNYLVDFLKLLGLKPSDVVESYRATAWMNKDGTHFPPVPEDYESTTSWYNAYKDWRGYDCVGPLCLRSGTKFWSDLYPYIPLASTEDIAGYLEADTIATSQPPSGLVNAAISFEPIDYPNGFDGKSRKLYFPHVLEVNELGQLLQSTYLAQGLPEYDPIQYRDKYDTQRCEIVEYKKGVGDTLRPNDGSSQNDGDSLTVEGNMVYSGEFTCDFNLSYPIPGDPPVSSVCDIEIKTALSLYVGQPKEEEVWNRLVNGTTSIFKKIFPKLGVDSAPIDYIRDIPAITSAIYSSNSADPDIQIFAGDDSKNPARSGTQAKIFFPHVGSLYDYFLEGIQLALRPQGYGGSIGSGDATGAAGDDPPICKDPITNIEGWPSTINTIINEASNKYGIPTCILKSIAQAEGSQMKYLTETEARRLSEKNWGPNEEDELKNEIKEGSNQTLYSFIRCAANLDTIRGPMQMSNNSFNKHATASGVANPSICNIRDAIFAAASFLVNERLPIYETPPFDWSDPRIYCASGNTYYGTCKLDKDACINLGQGYCDHVLSNCRNYENIAEPEATCQDYFPTN